jgi:hypothetical protein
MWKNRSRFWVKWSLFSQIDRDNLSTHDQTSPDQNLASPQKYQIRPHMWVASRRCVCCPDIQFVDNSLLFVDK